MSDFTPYEPNYDDWNKPSKQAWGQVLKSQMTDRYAGPIYRSAAYDRTATQQAASEQAIRDASATALGFGNTGGDTGAQIAAVRRQAPYAQADLMARELARTSAQQTGTAIGNRSQMKANYYSTLASLALQNKNIESNAAIGLAQLDAMGQGGSSGSSSSGLAGSAVGAIGNIASAYILSGGTL